MVAIDGTKMSANASINANRDFGQIAREILEETADIDRREDELYGTARGDALPELLRARGGGAGRCARPRNASTAIAAGRPSRPTVTRRSRSSLIRSGS